MSDFVKLMEVINAKKADAQVNNGKENRIISDSVGALKTMNSG